MTLFTFLLILGSACLHLVPHFSLKKAKDKAAFIWWMCFWASLLFLPVPLLYWQVIPAKIWIILGVSALFEALYYSAITKAYQSGDLSVVYPLARGTAPLFLLLWSVLFLQEEVSVGGFLGVGMVALGLYAINLPCFSAWKNAWKAFGQPAARWALFAGLCTSLYTSLDKVGVRTVVPQTYTYLVIALTLLWLTPTTLKKTGIGGLLAELKASRFSSLIAGLFALTAYAIVLFAMQLGVPASYAGAIREVSIVFAVLIGVVFLKETGSVMRVMGAIFIASGVAMIALWG